MKAVTFESQPRNIRICRINGTHREKLRFTQFTRRNYWNKSLATSTFFICLHNQLVSIHSLHITLSHIKEYRCLNKAIHQIDITWTVALFRNIYRKIWVGFCLNIGKRFVLQVSFLIQHKVLRLFSKTMLGTFETAFHLRDQHIFIWRSLGILNVFNAITLKQIF